ADGRMSGFDGCNWYDQFLAPDLTEVVTPGTMTATGCTPPFVDPVDPTGVGASLDGDVLILPDDGRTIRYRPLDALPPASERAVVGTWTAEHGDLELGADGTFETNGCTGRWSLSDGLLTVEVTGTVDGRCGTALFNELPNPADVRIADGALLLAERGDGNTRVLRLASR
ncbi:MAG: hypothetical protein ACRDZ2_09845, partial [Ilumatobacteraceae bacterium]